MDPVNLGAVVAGAIASFVIGWIWYGPLFGKVWRRLAGLTIEDMKSMKMTVMGASIGGIITSLLLSYVLAHGILFGNAFIGTTGVEGALQGAFWYWLGFAVPMTSMSYLWEGKPFKLWVLNAGYYLVTFMVMAVIFGLMPLG